MLLEAGAAFDAIAVGPDEKTLLDHAQKFGLKRIEIEIQRRTLIQNLNNTKIASKDPGLGL